MEQLKASSHFVGKLHARVTFGNKEAVPGYVPQKYLVTT